MINWKQFNNVDTKINVKTRVDHSLGMSHEYYMLT